MKKIICTTLSLLMVLAVLSGCSSGATSSSSAGKSSSSAPASKELKIALASDISSFDPRNATSTITAGVLAHMFNKLVKSDGKMNIEPDLAASYEQTNELTWRFHLRKDVTFQDGSKFTAKDVEYTLSTIKDKEKKYLLATDFSFMTAKVIDDYTVDISTADPYPGLLLRLNYVMIIPKDYVEKVGNEEFLKKPVGTGPYKFVERVKDEKIVLEASPSYFGGKSAINKLTFKIIPESAARIAALEAGDVNFCSGIPASEVKRLDALNNVDVIGNSTSRVTFLAINSLVKGPMQNVKVRQALNYAIDKQAVIKGVLDGYAKQVATLSCPEYEGYDASITPYEYNPTKAKELLAEAGYPTGLELEASYVSSAANSANVMQFIAAQLGEVGVKVKLSESEAAKQRDQIAAGTVSPLYFNAIGGPYANIDLLAKLCFSTGERYSTYSNTAFDALRQKAAITNDKAARDKLNSQIQQMIKDEAGAIFLYQPYGLYAMSSKLKGWTPRVDEMLLFYNTDLTA